MATLNTNEKRKKSGRIARACDSCRRRKSKMVPRLLHLLFFHKQHPQNAYFHPSIQSNVQKSSASIACRTLLTIVIGHAGPGTICQPCSEALFACTWNDEIKVGGRETFVVISKIFSYPFNRNADVNGVSMGVPPIFLLADSIIFHQP